MPQDEPERTMINSQNWPQTTSQEQTVANLTQIFEEELSAAKERAEVVLNMAKERVDEELSLAKVRVDEELSLAKTRAKGVFNFAKGRLDEELSLAKQRFLTRIISGIVKDGNQNKSAMKSIKLEFKNRISQDILTGDLIQGGHKCMQVALVDETTGEVIDVGPPASARVEIVVLSREFADDCWTAQEFNANIVGETVSGEKKPLLQGNVLLKLHRGVATLENIKFRHHTTKIKPPVFLLGARVVETFDGIRIKEAKTESFTVKDFRNKYSMKHDTPACIDEVWRLVNIRKGGKIHKRLEGMKISTVEDFLIQRLKDPKALKSVVNLGAKKWEATLKHALSCPPGRRMYCYTSFQPKRIIVFNLFGKALRLFPENQRPLISTLAENHEAKVQDLLAPCEHINDIVHFEDETSLHQHVTLHLQDVNALEFPNPNCLPPAHENVGPCDMISESTSIINTNSLSATKASVDDGMEIDAETQLSSQSLDQHTLFCPQFVDFLTRNDKFDLQLHDLHEDVNTQDEIDEDSLFSPRVVDFLNRNDKFDLQLQDLHEVVNTQDDTNEVEQVVLSI